MLLSLYQVVLPVSDIDQAEKFYSHLLGTPGRRVSPGQHHFECGGVILNCTDLSAEGDSSQTSSSPQRLYFVVEDIETVFERARSGGCPSMDEQILSQPWGDRAFTAEDPFKNSLGFVDQTTAIQRAGEQSAAGPDDCLKTGCALSIRSIAGESDGQLAAAVTKIFREEVWLKLAEPPPAHFKPGEKVRIQFGDGETVFFSETEIVKISATETQYVAISIPEKAQALQKRAIPRIKSEVPVSVSVLSATENQLVSAAPFDSKTHDISTAGLRFDTSLPLKKGDELKLKLLLSPEQEITVNAKVMGTKKVKRGGEAVTLVGTQFVEIQLDDQIKLLQFLIDAEESGKLASQNAPSQTEEPKTAPAAPKAPPAPKTPPAAPVTPAEVKSEPQEPKAAPAASKPKDEEPKAAPTEAPGAPEPPPSVPAQEAPPAAPEAPPAPEAPTAAPVAPAASAEPPVAPGVMKFKEEEPKAAPPAPEAPTAAPAAPAASAEPPVAPGVMKFKEEEPKVAPPAPEAPTAAPAAPAAPQAPATAPTPSAEPPAAPAAVKSQGAQEPTQPKELSWFAAQMNETEKTKKSGGVKAAVPQQAQPAEKPSLPIVKVSPSVQSGKAFLELSNGYHKPVTVKDVFAAKGAGSLTPLLTEPKKLSPGETQRLDVTKPLLPLFQQENAEVQDKLLHILFTLEPEPPDQPAPSRSLLRFDKGGFTEFSIK